MILRASTHIPPLRYGILQKGSYEVKTRPPEARDRKCTQLTICESTLPLSHTYIYHTSNAEIVLNWPCCNIMITLQDKHEADVGIEAVFAIAKQQRISGKSSAIEFKGTITEVLGSCHSLGVTVDSFHALKVLPYTPPFLTVKKFNLPDPYCMVPLFDVLLLLLYPQYAMSRCRKLFNQVNASSLKKIKWNHSSSLTLLVCRIYRCVETHTWVKKKEQNEKRKMLPSWALPRYGTLVGNVHICKGERVGVKSSSGCHDKVNRDLSEPQKREQLT